MSDDLERLLSARHHAPFALLGPHREDDRVRLRMLLPDATEVRLHDGPDLTPVAPMLYEWCGDRLEPGYRVSWRDSHGQQHCELDPYAFPTALDDIDLDRFQGGTHEDLAQVLGARTVTRDGVFGTRFTVWAPHAERVSVVGAFNRWDGRRHPMQVHGTSGVWRLFIPELPAGTVYRYEIRHRGSGRVVLKSDPLARAYRPPPDLESVVAAAPSFAWTDQAWMAQRGHRNWRRQAMSVYEVHASSWRRTAGPASPLRAMAEPLAAHVNALGFTHVELMPVMEHPFGGSWGYQTLGYFAPAGRYGDASDLCHFVDVMHQHGIAVLLDWTPAHFPRDAHGLAWFDGEPLYEYADPRLAVHPDWGTAVFDYGRGEVRSFLLSSALYWLETFHADGLRVDAVASMLYRDYSRAPGSWLPNAHGGRENLEAITFLRDLNRAVAARCPGALTIAEESTAWPMVTWPAAVGGLGFSLKWNLGWMHDTLDYLAMDPVYRTYHHDRLTFGILYAHSERFMLTFSHDEVVHGKASLLHKLPGDDWQKFATLRLLYGYLYASPGKKLLFMGAEFAVRQEWDHQGELDWTLLGYAEHRGVRDLLADLNRLYRREQALHQDHEPEGFQWIDCHDRSNSVLVFLRTNGVETVVVAANFTPVVRTRYRIGVPEAGRYQELLNSDSRHYGGTDVGNLGAIDSQPVAWMGRPACLELTLPPLAILFLKRHSPGAASGGGEPPHAAAMPRPDAPDEP